MPVILSQNPDFDLEEYFEIFDDYSIAPVRNGRTLAICEEQMICTIEVLENLDIEVNVARFLDIPLGTTIIESTLRFLRAIVQYNANRNN